jgi:hypothetical protein
MHAQQPAEACPWLNAATAAGVLGIEVRSSVAHPANAVVQPEDAPADSTCEFTPMRGDSVPALRIEVHTLADMKDFASYVARCNMPVQHLVGVGNEAVSCVLHDANGGTTEQVIGRVRERVFLLAWMLPPQADGPASDASTIRSKLQNTAEQVAGSLF